MKITAQEAPTHASPADELRSFLSIRTVHGKPLDALAHFRLASERRALESATQNGRRYDLLTANTQFQEKHKKIHRARNRNENA